MLILSIFGSPRKTGFSSAIHNEFLTAFEESGAEIINKDAYSLDLSPCIACGKCRDRGFCIYDDDMTEIYRLIRKADIITVSCPVYFSSFPSPLKAVMDRCQVIWEEVKRGEYPEKKRRGFFISTGGSEYSTMFTGLLLGIKHFFNILDVSFSEDDTILYQGTDRWDKISLDIIGNCRNIGVNYAKEYIKKYSPGADSG